ncbi:Uncharacterised protein [Vibrio cholerae]|uniref:Uncharacterized protein n=1 Tax=Vibrio cholerae TaxID=666 RepID=A0A655VM17_VIBCL|nr:Uncharacterised protein [Vibrio cholerae]CSB70432.1 Uncharacterised protein [Vibrio cholerae]CSB89498.1 Uncharacterised protein [Vibrio cholerae]CSB91922.1 Uncharacterised protein [Vibrio cholerae]CSC04116.1 Uncharacterised protein [Vibrio cholerae]
MLEWNIQVRQHFSFCHQWDDFIHMWVRVNVVQTNPNAHFAKLFTERFDVVAHR